MRILISGGRVIDPANGRDERLDLAIEAGRIAAIGQAPTGFKPDRTLDASGQFIMPGIVDLGARMREPGQEQKATIASEARAASAGGITTLCVPPDTDPIADTPAVVELLRQRAEATGQIEILPIGALTQQLAGEALSELAELQRAGCLVVSNVHQPFRNTLVQRRAMEYAATHSLTVLCHSQDQALVNNGCVHEGPVSTRLGLPGVPEAAETVAVARDLELAEQTGVRLHFCRLSTARGIRMVARARHDGLPVTADVSIYHLHLVDTDVIGFDSNQHNLPPYRSAEDRQALRAAVAEGMIDAICSDHQPHDRDAKLAPFPETEPGLSALELLLPLGLKLVQEQVIELPKLVAALTTNPARVLGAEHGGLKVGSRADLAIVDPAAEWVVTEKSLLSFGKNTPLLGDTLRGRVTHTVFNGSIVYELKL